MIPILSTASVSFIPVPATEIRVAMNVPNIDTGFRALKGPTSTNSTFEWAFIQAAPAGVVVSPPESENVILSRLGPPQRWNFIAKKHPFEFWGAIVALFVACFIVIHTIWLAVPNLLASPISTAFAQAPAFKRAYIKPIVCHSHEYLQFQQKTGLVAPDDALAKAKVD